MVPPSIPKALAVPRLIELAKAGTKDATTNSKDSDLNGTFTPLSQVSTPES
jgi:hypothetical protein